MSTRAIVIAVATVGALAAIAAFAIQARLIVVVPEADGTLEDARRVLSRANLNVVAVSETGGDNQPRGAELVVEQRPRAGSLALRGSTVHLTSSPPYEEVTVPGLLGMFASDAAAELDAVGLRASGPRGGADEVQVVFSQEPAAGAVVPFGTSVSYKAQFPHSREQTTSPEVRSVHGILYARYGLNGADACTRPCHTARTCSGPGCHDESAYRYLGETAPQPR